MTIAKLDIDFVKPFLLAAVKTLKLKCDVQASAGRPVDISRGPHPLKINIAGIIGVTSPKFVGSVALCFPESTFLKIMERMLGRKFSEINKDLEDGACELLNVIYGSAKVDLDKMGHQLEKAIPSVVRGEAVNVKHVSETPTILIPFQTPLGKFSIDINLQNILNKSAA